MRTRARREHLQVLHDPSPVDGGPAADRAAEPQEYGVRVVWQSEAVKIEAAEFLVATRVQEASRRRLARAIARLRDSRAAQQQR